VTEIVSESGLGEPDDEAWQRFYVVRRDDGHEATIEASGTASAAETVRNVGDEEALECIADMGRTAALRYAERAQSPERRGKVLVRLRLDPLSGFVAKDYEYERSL
jgi:hypothetical protein